jgi:hypothetical protein
MALLQGPVMKDDKLDFQLLTFWDSSPQFPEVKDNEITTVTKQSIFAN